jgi:DNA-directed RNA polymerase subunit omega
MIYPSADALENWGSKYSLVVLVAKRAKQIKSGAPPLVETSSRNPLTIALEEVAAGKILCQVADHDILPKTTQEAEVAQLLAIPTLSLDDEASSEEAEAIALFSDEAELLSEDEEEEELEHGEGEEDDVAHAPGLDEEAEEEDDEEEEEPLEVPELGLESDDADEERRSEAAVEEPEIIAEPAPKPKRGRKKKEPEVVAVDEPEAVDSEESED